MTVTLDNLKISLRVDSAVDDDLLRGYILAATNYIKNAIGTDDDKFYADDNISPLVDVATIALASGYYTFRTSLSLVQAFPVDLATNSIIAQLRGNYADYLAEKGVFDGDKPT
ncbi:phage gp6-like head-tail connector protein [Leuconostoc citreum]|uniref:head-tail connector protein n=1 Tax=Leuconostoc citreum TaxID=33964 RepID=UPI0021A758B7|nr:head-tail connector protein [Leuconostoc citreum]MCT3055754.1 phage gp6-like head-tail connector protein [Leuconostoc citreum]MCT3062277.1 phage gp6-like head-tail connector protein [Leuconostoc citreum]